MGKGKYFYSKGEGNDGYIKNLEVLGYCDLDGKAGMFQMALYRTESGRYLLYGAAFAAGPEGVGIMISDVTDPRDPVFIKKWRPFSIEEYPTTSIPKLQIADDKLVFALTSGSGPGVLVGDRAKMKSLQGIMVYDLKKDPENPEFLGYWDCGVPYSMGVHRFMYNGGDYVHLSAEADEHEGMIYRIVDISDPQNIKEVGRWWAPHQYIYGVPGREVDHSAPHNPDFMDKGWMHGPPFVLGDKAYLGYGGDGLYVLDVSDFTRPKALGQLRFMPAFSSRLAGARTHTALPLKGRDLCVVTNEGERFGFIKDGMVTQAQAVNNIHMVDVSDPANPVLIAEFPYPEVPEDFPAPNFNTYCLAEGSKGGPFGPHNLHEPMDGKPWLEQRTDVVYDCYFAAGLRIYDVSDPFYIKEKAYFIPPNPTKKFFPFPGPMMAMTEDIVVDDRGNIIIDANSDGFYILRKTYED
ncbi:MAG: hypothetical protein IJH62_00710 [Mogibacterium sp.]|nr:hypothetical protein [Mogibacterium sp.]